MIINNLLQLPPSGNCVNDASSFVQYISSSTTQSLCEIEIDTNEDENDVNDPRAEEIDVEENAIMYVAGYVCRKILHHVCQVCQSVLVEKDSVR